MERYLRGAISEHLKKFRQIVFLVGPRQVGKTTLAKGLLPEPKSGYNYFNWDIVEHRRILTTQVFKGDVDLKESGREILVFDEIHKYPRWKNSIKGLFDSYEPHTHWIVTGSAALNIFRKGQDSLLGRSFLYQLCPFSVAELSLDAGVKAVKVEQLLDFVPATPTKETQEIFENLLRFGGFPEPYFKGEMSFLTRWRSSRLERLINQDLASTEHLKDLSLLENLMFLLPERVGSPLSVNSLREDLEVHHATAKHWTELLERVFYGFSIRPYSGKLARTLKKEPKWYLWDSSEVKDEGVRFENLVAVHLMKYVTYVNNLGLDELSLFYVRDKEKREVDFLICRARKPAILIECKLHDRTPSEALAYFGRLFKVKRAVQLNADSHDPISKGSELKIEIVSASGFLKELV